ncbi:MAG TPA: hypothetical protein VFJ02_22975 [Vicinamibacterales bacterium]|nr:hypothetical protein [Vicinamibacterales bacterium]
MATLERGKGKRKQTIEILRHGRILERREVEAVDARLPGYRHLADDAAARAALAAEVRALLDDGMQPADDEARAIADARPAKPSGAPLLPIRQDLAIYNEATGFVVTSRKMAGKVLDEGSTEWKKAVTKGDMIPLTLVQDEPFVIRVVAGGPLTAPEQQEWVARVDWHLSVPDGKLCITGGSVFTNDGYDEDDPQYEEFVGEIMLPKGRYRAALYTLFHGVNGGAVLDELAGGHHRGESLEAWFARTRSSEATPDWDAMETVDFLVHLEPAASVPKSGLSPLPDEGWFNGMENARKPERCPLGLATENVIRRRDETPGTWTYVRTAFEHLPAVERRRVAGGPVRVPLESVANAVRLAWLASRFITAELRLTPPASSALDLSGDWPDGIIAVVEGAVGRLLCDNDVDINEILTHLPSLGKRLAALPKGTTLEVCCVPYETLPGAPAEAGLLTMRGAIEGDWLIADAYPAVDAATLRAALALAAEIDGGTAITVRDDAEGNAILEWAAPRVGRHLKPNPPTLVNGAIRFKKPGHEVALLGIAAFTHRFGSTWPIARLSPEHQAPEDDEDGHTDEEDDGLFPTTPLKGAEVFRAASGRVYNATMAMLVSEKIGADIPKRERPLFGAGFKHVGDIVSSADEKVGIRGYARPGGHAWACFRVSAPATVAFEIVSTFADGNAVLVTTDRDGERDEPSARMYRQGIAGAGLKDLIARHEERATELNAVLGAPRPIEPSLRSLAETIEAVRLKS